MIELNIPGRETIQLNHLVCDVNGTLAEDGQLYEGLPRLLNALQDRLAIHLLTADTHGKQDIIDHQLNLQAVRVQPGNESAQKAAFSRGFTSNARFPCGHRMVKRLGRDGTSLFRWRISVPPFPFW